MIKIVIAYDDNDIDLGDYFEESFRYLVKNIEAANETPTSVIRGLDCTEDNINNAIAPVNANPFLFVGISHGDITGRFLLTSNDTYVSSDNALNFCNSFFYSTGCNIGQDLGLDLINNHCKVFIGYDGPSYAPLDEQYNLLFIECELYALIKFLINNEPIIKLYTEMLSVTQDKIDWLTDQNEIIEAMNLQDNKDCMILLGDEAKVLTKNDFDI
jgi:hypothetical protein